MSTDSLTESLTEKLRAACERHLSQAVVIDNLRTLTGGAASATSRFDLHRGQDTMACILRASQGAEAISTGIDKTTEALVQRAAYDAGVPVARILFVLDEGDGLGEGFVMECIAGESIPQKILRDPQFLPATGVMTAQCAEILAAIHGVSVAGLTGLPVLSATQQLDRYEAIYRETGEALPCFELALRWLRLHAPAEDTAVQLVHGDFRLGNFLVDADTGITAVLDWELAHAGDPMEDLGWLCVNSWRFGQRDKPVGGFGQREELFACYEETSGVRVDPARVHYWETFGVLKWGIICLYMAWGHLRGEERSVERAAIGRRVSETEIDLLQLLAD